MHELLSGPVDAELGTFRYDAVVAEFNRVGKHFVGADLLAALDVVRQYPPYSPGPARDLLNRFLDCALDKWDNRYDYTTYTALDLLPMPAGTDRVRAFAQRDRLVRVLVADALRFEHMATDQRTELLPEMRPDGHTVAKRCRLGLRCVRPDWDLVGVSADSVAADPVAASRRMCDAVAATLSEQDRLIMRLSMLPVYISHDEYLFIRVLQSFEATFALLTVLLRNAVEYLADGAASAAIRCVDNADTALRRAAPLFSLLATMQVRSFRTFRQFTEGASAIQSRNYKAMESLCRRPDDERLDSPAYRSVPEVRAQVLRGVPNLDTTLGAAWAAGRIVPNVRDELVEAMHRFASTLAKWRDTHYRLAVRMLGTRSGTGYTEGTPYLRSVMEIPVFTVDLTGSS